MTRYLLSALAFFMVLVPVAFAEERILDYHSDIEVFTDGSMQVTETIRVRSELQEIKRGIYRDFPTDYRDHIGNRYRVGFEVLGVTRDGREDGWHTQATANGVRVYMGRKNVYLERGDYSYTLTYRTNRQLGFFDDHDELYWNVTGNHWNFPIDKASARVILPGGIPSSQLIAEAYSGPLGAKGQDYTTSIGDDGMAHFAATRELGKGEGLTIVLAWPKGYLHEPTAREEFNYLLRDNSSWLILVIGLLVLSSYYLLAWVLVGRDPEEGVIIARYGPPPGVTPAAARLVVKMGYDHKVFATAVVGLAVKGLVNIKEYGKKFTLQRTDAKAVDLAPGEKVILKHLFNNIKGISFDLDQKSHAKISKMLKAHKAALLRNNEKIYFMRNRAWLVPGIVGSVLLYAGVIYGLPGKDLKMIGLFMSFWLTFWTLGVFTLCRKVWHSWRNVGSPLDTIAAIFITLFSIPFVGAEIFVAVMLSKEVSPTLPVALISAVCINVIFHYLLKAPTRTGRQLLDHLEGFRQFLDVAEREEMNFRNPPEKTPELFERFLPYALALGVEQHWMERFAGMFLLLEERGEHYRPIWYHGKHWHVHDLGSFSNALGSSLSSAVASSSAAPGSSSGSGGGGSSGGGGGGGGGGGW